LISENEFFSFKCSHGLAIRSKPSDEA